MFKPEDLVRQYMPEIKIMQLATSVGDEPWLCALHYFSDDELNLYWISTEAREHSQHIKQNPNVAAYVLVHENTPEEDYVIGISIIGNAELLGSQVEDKVGDGYLKKQGKDPSLLTEIAGGKNPHKFYRLKPKSIVLFDSKNFPTEPRQTMEMK